MTTPSFLTRASPIGVEIRGRYVHAVQTVSGPRGQRVCAAACFPRLDSGQRSPADEAPRIAGVLRRRGFVGNRISLAVPEGHLHTAVLELPPRSSGAPLEQIAAMEMARLFKIDGAGIEVALWQLPAPARATANQCMAAACPQEGALKLCDAFSAAGLSVRAIEPGMTAATRAASSWHAGRGGSTLLVDLGWKDAHLVVVCDQVIVYERRLDGVDFQSLRSSLARTVRRTDAAVAEMLLMQDPAMGEFPERLARARDQALQGHCDELAQQVRVSLAYVEHRYPNSPALKTLLFGECAALPGLAELLQKSAGVETRALGVSDVAQVPPYLLHACDPGAITAFGLTLEGTEPNT
jgi:Tfp pilus assembly PilM family ATPase